MFMNDVYKKEEIRNVAISDLRNRGIKYRPKKIKNVQESKNGRKVFKTHLHLLPMQTVTLETGQQLKVPKIVHELCSFILTRVETEGLFRKGGSKSRQNEIRLLLEAGCHLTEDHHEIDVANVLKTFLRELPEPLVPYSYHEMFLRCVLLESDKLQAVLLACLLLPQEHLNTLAYTMQFLYQVTEFSYANKMDAYNIAVVIGPTILPTEEKIALNAQHRLAKCCELFKLLVENANGIGVLPENIIERIALSSSNGSLSEDDLANKKKKKRRSGSLTRMFSGLKKIVSNRSNEDNATAIVMPDLLITPRIHRSGRKRKTESTSRFASKKKQEVLSSLTEGALRTPITPARTPVNIQPNVLDKKPQWYSKVRSQKTRKRNSDEIPPAQTTKTIERRWSAVSHVASFKRAKKRSSPPKKTFSMSTIPTSEPDYVKISKTEYEEIKNRVSAIERRISLELESVESGNVADDVIDNVQSEYEKTLTQSEHLSPTTDQLAKRLGKNLKIRRSCENKVFRSPSARKIERRRSRELEKAKIARNQSWHVTSNIPRIGVKRELAANENFDCTPVKMSRRTTRACSFQGNLPLTPLNAQNSRSPAKISRKNSRASPFQVNSALNNAQTTPKAPATVADRAALGCALADAAALGWRSAESGASGWTSAEGFFNRLEPSALENNRASLAKLRRQNAGMVLAKAKLFEEQKPAKIGAIRRLDRKLPLEEKEQKRRLKMHAYNTRLSDKENQGFDVGDSQGIVKSVPVIKRPLTVKSPKKLCHTPKALNEKMRTPLKVTSTLKQIENF